MFCFSILFGQQMDKDSIYLNVEKMPIIKGGFAAVGKKIKYPNIESKNAEDNNIIKLIEDENMSPNNI